MSFDYQALADLALELLTEFGRSVTHRTFTEGTYDVSTGTASTTTADVTRIGAKFDFKDGQTTERGALIQSGDFQLLLDPTATVSMQDVFVIDSLQYSIVSIGEVNPAGTRVLYDIHIRS